MEAIKLLKVDTLPSGTIRLQSQLLVGTDTADFIIDNGVLKNYGRGENGFDFYEYKKPFEIVKNKKDMKHQPL